MLIIPPPLASALHRAVICAYINYLHTMAAFIGLQQDSLEFSSNASISAYPGQEEESAWTPKASRLAGQRSEASF